MFVITLTVNILLVLAALSQTGVAALAAVMLLACQAIILLVDLLRLKKGLVEIRAGGRIEPRLLSSHGRSVIDLLDAFLDKLNTLQWQIDRLSRPVKKEASLLLSDQLSTIAKSPAVDKAAYLRMLELTIGKSAADALAVIYQTDGSNCDVVSTGAEGSRFTEALKTFAGHLNAAPDGSAPEPGGVLSLFGFRYCLARRFCWRAGGMSQRGLVWFGYKRYPPSALEKDLAQRMVLKIESEVPAIFELHKLSGKVREVQSSCEAKSQFLAQMSHDIRSPLHNIRASLRCAEELTEDPDMREVLEVALTNCSSLEDLVCGILDFSKHQAGKLTANPVVFDIKKEVAATLSQYQVQARSKNLALQYVFPDEKPWHVRADKNQIHRVLSNLISNAIKYTEDGSVIVSGQETGNTLALEVMDTGCGLSEKEQLEIFDPYVRLQSKIDGVGLGLPICKILCELNAGTIAVRSAKGQGSVFSIRLPAASSSIGLQQGSIERLSETQWAV